MTCAGLEAVRADGTAHRAARSIAQRHDRRPFVVRFERVHVADRAFRPGLPRPLERRTIHRGVEGLEELPVRLDGLGYEVASRRGEHGPALRIVGVEQILTGPSL